MDIQKQDANTKALTGLKVGDYVKVAKKYIGKVIKIQKRCALIDFLNDKEPIFYQIHPDYIQEIITPEWTEFPLDLLEGDVEVATYKGWKICLCVPNEGILGANILTSQVGYYFSNESFEIDNLYYDKDWHIQQAIKEIERLEGTQIH